MGSGDRSGTTRPFGSGNGSSNTIVWEILKRKWFGETLISFKWTI